MRVDPEWKQKYGPYALVAGASEGLGAEFALQLAERGLSLVLVARRAEKLSALADQIREKYGVDVRTVALDLGAPDLEARAAAATADIEVGLLVYNAALSVIGSFLDQSVDDALRMVDVNCRGPLVLSHLYGRPMRARGRGGVILMSSLAGTQGTAMLATYSATKAFNLVLAEGLWDELARSGVDVLACRAGATRTPNYLGSKPRESGAPMMEAAPVVREALDTLGRTPSMVPGFANRAAAFFLGHLLSRRAAIRIISRATRGMYE